MPKPFKLQNARPLPPGAEVVTHEGRPHVRFKERGRPVLYPLTADGVKYLAPSKRWYFKYRDATGTLRRVKGYTDLKATEQLAAETERKSARAKSGYSDPAEEHAQRPLADHLTDYAAHLEAKGNTPKHVALSTGRVRTLLTGSGAVFLRDVDAARVAEWLNGIRRGRSPVALPDGVGAFRPSEAASILGVSLDALAKSIRRHQLPAAGNGKARRLPRATVQELVDRAARGSGPGTVNHYVRAVRGFFNWLVKARRIGSNPLDSLSLVNARVDVRRARRELTADELRRLFDAARTSARTFRGLSGVDRYFLYALAAATGFRAGALAGLTPAEFDLDADTPVVTLAARLNKSRRLKVQPLPADVAAALRGHLAGKPAGVPVWPGSWAKDYRAAEMLRLDLEAAGIPYAVQGADGPEYADFHGLRHSFLTMLGRHGVDLRTAQELAGHSTPTLTAKYMHVRLHDVASAVGKLPELVSPTSRPDSGAGSLRMTGTDDDGASAVPPAVPAGYSRRHRSAPSGNLRVVGGDDGGATNALEMQGAGADLHRPASDRMSEPGGDRTHDQRIKSPLLYRLSYRLVLSS